MPDGIGYLTPDATEFGSVTDCRTVTLPLSLWYLANGALQELTKAENWVQFGTATPEETAAFFLEALDNYGKCMPVGSVIPLVTNSLTDGLLPCDGSIYQRVDYPELYDALNPALIVDADNFVTPNLNGRFLLADGNGRSIGEVGGEETHTLILPEIPAHTHNYMPPVADIDVEPPAGLPMVAASAGTPIPTSSTGGGQPHNNMPPYYVIRYGIVAK